MHAAVDKISTDAARRIVVAELLSAKAAGVGGLTPTSASVVMFAQLDWTPGTPERCEDRAHHPRPLPGSRASRPGLDLSVWRPWAGSLLAALDLQLMGDH